MTAPTGTFNIPPGLVAVTTWGMLTAETAQSLLDIQAFNVSKNVQNLAYRLVPGSLVDKTRNEVCRMMLNENLGWCLMIDADMTVPPDAVLRILQTAFHTRPEFDVVGGYCCLRGDKAIPTIDTGTGTWESHYPGSGVLEVMRTGAAFLLIKRHVCERVAQPWFAMRVPMRPLDALAELDVFCRTKFDGSNPLRHLPGDPWERIERVMMEDPAAAPERFLPLEVGEDSGFCDRIRTQGLRIAVDTDIAIGHLHRESIGWEKHRDAMESQARTARYFSGLTA